MLALSIMCVSAAWCRVRVLPGPIPSKDDLDSRAAQISDKLNTRLDQIAQARERGKKGAQALRSEGAVRARGWLGLGAVWGALNRVLHSVGLCLPCQIFKICSGARLRCAQQVGT